MPEFSAGKVTDYADGDRKVIDCGEQEVGIFKIDGEFFAWHNRCAHRAGPVCQGRSPVSRTWYISPLLPSGEMLYCSDSSKAPN